jgi:transcriptional regulator NrdR family protein
VSVTCPHCKSIGQVLDTRRYGETITRRRYCAYCEAKWTTRETGDDTEERLRRENERLRTILSNIRASLAGAFTELPHVGEGGNISERATRKHGA